jgi:hypothetical protein
MFSSPLVERYTLVAGFELVCAAEKTYRDSVQAAHNSWRTHAQKYGVQLDFKPSHIAIKRGQEIIKIAPKHEIYLWDMMEYFDHYFGAVESEVGGVVDYSRPRRHKLRNSGVSFEYPSLLRRMKVQKSIWSN